jgi:pimeloyl-ACP methyl ester carboxylesterase
MDTVISSDGTKIAYDLSGEGPTVILVGGALRFRKFKGMEELARLLSDRCTVINYDRRGRGDSTDTAPFVLEREVEDIAALIEAAGGRASPVGLVVGWRARPARRQGRDRRRAHLGIRGAVHHRSQGRASDARLRPTPR